MDIKVEDGNLVVSIPLEDVNNAAGNNGRPLKWMKDRRYRIYIPFSEDEHDHLVKWAIKRWEIMILDTYEPWLKNNKEKGCEFDGRIRISKDRYVVWKGR